MPHFRHPLMYSDNQTVVADHIVMTTNATSKFAVMPRKQVQLGLNAVSSGDYLAGMLLAKEQYWDYA